jgi:Leucine-rich repeat (LRR) protein
MNITDQFVEQLGPALARVLFARYVGLSEPTTASLAELAGQHLQDPRTRRETVRLFEGLGDQVAFKLAEFHKALKVPESAATVRLAEVLAQASPPELFERPASAARLGAALARQTADSESSADFRRACETLARFLVEFMDELPPFTQGPNSLRLLRSLSDEADSILQRVSRLASLFTSATTTDPARPTEVDYRLKLLRKYNVMELFGADIRPESKRHALSVAYVSLNLETPTEEKGTAEGSTSLSAESLLRTLAPSAGRLLIRGEAGSGKSTLFRWACVKAADPLLQPDFLTQISASFYYRKMRQAASTDPGPRIPELSRIIANSTPASLPGSGGEATIALSEVEAGADISPDEVVLRLLGGGEKSARFYVRDWRLHVPFLVRLRDCAEGQLPTPAVFPDLLASGMNVPANWVRSVLVEGRGLILLDGIDEIPESRREHLSGQVTALLDAYPQNYFILSTRPEAVPKEWLKHLGFREARINPMSANDIDLFIQKWYEAVGQELQRQGRADSSLDVLARHLAHALRQSPAIARLATNPLLCAMICALHRERSQKLPESQAELCEALSQMLLHRRELEVGLDLEGFPEPYRRLSYEQKRAVVQEIACRLVRNGISAMTASEADEAVAHVLGLFPGHSPKDATTVRRCLVERSGILREALPERIDFLHNTFKEYLAAERFVAQGELDLLVKKALDTEWQPVVLFAVGTRTPGVASRIVRGILESSQWSVLGMVTFRGELLRPNALFAQRCRAAALYLDPDLSHELEKNLKTLFPPQNTEEAESLASLGELALAHLEKWTADPEQQAAACARLLRLVGTQRARQMLEDALDDRRLRVVSELARAVDPLRLRLIRTRVLEGRTLPEDISREVKDVRGLADVPKGTVERLNLTGTGVSDLAPLAGLTALQTLDLTRTGVSDLTPLASLTALRILDLRGTRVSTLAPLARLTSLQQLYLIGTGVSDLAPLAGLTAMQLLYLSKTRVSDVLPLAGLTALLSLGLDGTNVSDLAPLAGLTALQSLELRATSVSDLAPLARLDALRILDLRDTNVSDLAPLVGLSALQMLDLDATNVSDLSPLVNLTSLQRLYLIGTGVSDLTPLAHLAALQGLYLGNTKVSDVLPLAGLIRLQRLSLIGTGVSDLAPLAGLLSLQMLLLRGTGVSDLAPLAGLAALEQLDLEGTDVSDLAPLARLTALRTLSLVGTKVSDLAPLAGLPKLREVYLSRDLPGAATLAARGVSVGIRDPTTE